MPTIRIKSDGSIGESRHTKKGRTTTPENEAVRWQNFGATDRTITFGAKGSPFTDAGPFTVPAGGKTAWLTIRPDVDLDDPYPYAPPSLSARAADRGTDDIFPMSGPEIIVESGDGGGLVPPPAAARAAAKRKTSGRTGTRPSRAGRGGRAGRGKR